MAKDFYFSEELKIIFNFIFIIFYKLYQFNFESYDEQ